MKKSYFTLGLLSLWMAVSYPLSMDGDLYWHLAAGRRIVQNHALDSKEIYSYLSPGSSEEMHEWLSQVIPWLVKVSGGDVALKVFYFILILIIVLLVAKWIRDETGSEALAFLAGVLTLVVHREFHNLRAMVAGEVLFSVLVFWVFRRVEALSRARLFSTIIILLAWSNLHGSSLLFPFIASIYSTSFVYLMIASRKKWGPLALLSATLPVWSLVLLLLFHPDHLRAYSEALHLSELGRKLGVDEWSLYVPPLGTDLDTLYYVPTLWLRWLALPSVLVLWWSEINIERRAQILFVSLNSLFIVVISSFSIRHRIYSSILVVAFVLAVSRLVRVLNLEKIESAASFAMSVLLLCFMEFWGSSTLYYEPERAVRILKQMNLQGNLMNEVHFGPYLAYSLFPQVRVGLTKRLLVDEKPNRAMDVIYDEEGFADYSKFAEQYPETEFLLIRSWTRERPDRKKWICVFENNLSSLFVKRGRNSIRSFQEYYSKRGIPFSIENGFSLEATLKADPRWAEEEMDKPIVGWFPLRKAREQWAEFQAPWKKRLVVASMMAR